MVLPDGRKFPKYPAFFRSASAASLEWSWGRPWPFSHLPAIVRG